jgi:hypothetical protein
MKGGLHVCSAIQAIFVSMEFKQAALCLNITMFKEVLLAFNVPTVLIPQ